MGFYSKTIFLLFTITFITACIPPKDKSTRQYENSWESLKTHETPEWFLDAKFGIYCHWGPYSVPEFENEWYSHWMYCNEGNPEAAKGDKYYTHHNNTYGTLDTFGYKDFIPMFTAEKFDASEWAELFKNAGARFAGPVSEHADGFAMWDSDLTEWDAKDMGPKQDIMGLLSHEIRKRDMKFIATYHRQWLYGWYPTWDETTDAANPKYAGLYGPKLNKGDFQYPDARGQYDGRHYPLADAAFNEEWISRLKEIVQKYDPDLVWFDNKMDIIDEEVRKEFLSYYYNHAAKNNKEVLATYKFNDFAKGTAVLDLERSRMSEKKSFPWLTDDSIDWKSWSHINNPRYKSTNRIIDFLLDVISKNGCLLLNITPKANGEIPNEVEKRLLEIGQWLEINGEGVYGTRPFTVYGEGSTSVVEGHLSENKNADNTAEDIRFTTKGDMLYAYVLDWPGASLSIRSLGTSSDLNPGVIKSIEMLGSNHEIQYQQNDSALIISLPNEKPHDYAYGFRIEF